MPPGWIVVDLIETKLKLSYTTIAAFRTFRLSPPKYSGDGCERTLRRNRKYGMDLLCGRCRVPWNIIVRGLHSSVGVDCISLEFSLELARMGLTATFPDSATLNKQSANNAGGKLETKHNLVGRRMRRTPVAARREHQVQPVLSPRHIQTW